MQSYSGIVIQKNGDIKEINIKSSEISDELYKKCNFRKSDGFEQQCEWKVKVNKVPYNIKAYGRKSGKSGSENKYEFPPPIDTTLFYGNMLVMNYSGDSPSNLDSTTWEKIYEKLFGGFENLDDTKEEDENEKDELADIPKKFKTKNGYLKDGFVVDETEKISNTSNDEDEDEEEEYDDDEDEDDDEVIDPSLNSSSELEEEEYEYTDDEL